MQIIYFFIVTCIRLQAFKKDPCVAAFLWPEVALTSVYFIHPALLHVLNILHVAVSAWACGSRWFTWGMAREQLLQVYSITAYSCPSSSISFCRIREITQWRPVGSSPAEGATLHRPLLFFSAPPPPSPPSLPSPLSSPPLFLRSLPFCTTSVSPPFSSSFCFYTPPSFYFSFHYFSPPLPLSPPPSPRTPTPPLG